MKVLFVILSLVGFSAVSHSAEEVNMAAVCKTQEGLISNMEMEIQHGEITNFLTALVFKMDCKDVDQKAPDALQQCKAILEAFHAKHCQDMSLHNFDI